MSIGESVVLGSLPQPPLAILDVWEALRRSSSFAVSLGPEKLLIEILVNSVGSRALFDKGPGEWGPDLAPTHLPDLTVSDIVREKAFFVLTDPALRPPTSTCYPSSSARRVRLLPLSLITVAARDNQGGCRCRKIGSGLRPVP